MASSGEVNVKVVFLGASAVGKTSIVVKGTTGSFDPDQANTVGAAYALKVMDVEGTKVNLQIWDTAGQEHYRSLAPMYYHSAQIAILVFSLIDASTFNEVEKWMDELREHLPALPIIYLIGNKADLDDKRQLSAEKPQMYADEIGATYFETSALNGKGIDDFYTHLANTAYHSPSIRNTGNLNVQQIDENPDPMKLKQCKC